MKIGLFFYYRFVESWVILNENDNWEFFCMRLVEFGGRDKDEVCVCDEGEVMFMIFLMFFDGELCFWEEVGKLFEVLYVFLKE